MQLLSSSLVSWPVIIGATVVFVVVVVLWGLVKIFPKVKNAVNFEFVHNIRVKIGRQ